jgi:ATP-binding cassette subfamily A (ABC1) protein 3
MADSKLIYLDEPTSGMDTSARRYIWTMLKNYKSSRIVVLTTHFMDEADFLGDRIGIMGEGKLICCGSSVYLKNQFGVGYNLTMVKANTNVDSAPIIQMVERSITDSKVISNVSAEVTFSLPLGSVKEFPAFFDDLDDSLRRLQISSYGISMTTLEEVFLRVAQIGAGHKQVDDFIKNESKDEGDSDNFDINTVRIVNAGSLFLNHSLGLIKKRINYFRRDLRSLACEIFLPCIIVIAGLCLLTISFVKDAPIITISASNFPWSETQVSWDGVPAAAPYFQDFDSIYEITKMDATGTGIAQISNADELYFQSYDIKEALGWYFVNEVSGTSMNYAIFGNTIQTEAYPIMLNQMN